MQSKQFPLTVLSSLVTIGTAILLPLDAAWSLTKQEVARIATQVTVKINDADLGNETGGSGVIVGKVDSEYTVLTNCHVIRDTGRFEIVTPDNFSHSIELQDIDGVCHDSVDLALVKFNSDRNYQVAILATTEAQTADVLYIAGFPSNTIVNPNSDYQYTHSSIRSFHFDGGGDRTITSILPGANEGYEIKHPIGTSKGMSGGPIFNQAGEVIGLNGFLLNREREGIVDYFGVPIRFYQQWETRNIVHNNAEEIETRPTLTEDNDSREQRVIALLEEGQQYHAAQQYQEALESFDAAIRLDPENAIAYNKRGITYREGTQEYDRAIADYNRAIELNPNYAEAYYNRGNAHYDIQEYDREIADYSRAIELNPNYIDAYIARGMAYSDKEEYDQAITNFNRAIELDPDNASDAYTSRGITYSEQQKYDLAIADYTRAIELNPDFSFPYNNRGNIYSEQQKYDLAIADYTRAIELNPFPAAYNNRGLVYFEKQEYERAIIDYTNAIEAYPNYASAYYNRADTYEKQGNTSLALQDFRRAANLFEQQNETYWYEKALNRIEQLNAELFLPFAVE